MSDTDKIVAEMPKVSINNISEDDQVEFGVYPHAVEIIAEAQCQLLAEQGWRKLRTQYEILEWLRRCYPGLEEICSLDLLAQELHRFFMEGE